MAFTSLPGIDFELEGYQPDENMDRLSLGFKQQLATDISLQGTYSLRKTSDDQQQGVGLVLTVDW